MLTRVAAPDRTKIISRKNWLLPAALACTLAAPWSALAGSSYLAVWSSDKADRRQTRRPQYRLSRRHRCRSKVPNLR